jgi:MATE family multidrug resistance protein
MIKKNEINAILIVALPLMAAFLAERGMQFIDSFMMGWLGPTALAAGALGTAVFFTILIFCMGVLSAVGVFIVREKGAGTISNIKSIMQHGFCLALFLSFPCMLVIWFVSPLLLKIGEDPRVVADMTLFLHGIVWGLPGFLLFLVLREFISAFSLTMIVMIVSLFSIPLTFVVNTILVYGKYFFPPLGIAGIGYGGAMVMWFMFLCLFIYSKKHILLKEHLGFRPFKFDWQKMNDILHVGLPSGTLFLVEAGLFLATAILMGYFGVAALAAYQIAMQCINIAYAIPISLAMATALRIGHAAGEKNFPQIQRTALLSFAIALFFSAMMVIVFVCASNFLVSIFLEKGSSHFKEVRQLAITFLHIAALFLCFDAMQSVANGALRGLKDTFVPMLFSIGCYWIVGVGGAYYLSLHTRLGTTGVWCGLILGLGSTAVILMLRFFLRLQQSKYHFTAKSK